MIEEVFDYIIVGAGAAGCVIAARLTEDPKCRVLLVEAGGENTGPMFSIPGVAGLAALSKANNWSWMSQTERGLNDRSIELFQGRGLGGSSSINAMLYVRGHSNIYDRWAATGCHGWSFQDVLPYFRRSERNLRGASYWHGADGEMHVRPARSTLPICQIFLDAASEAGFPIVDDFNRDIPGFGFYDVNVKGGIRSSTAEAFLKVARRRANLTVWTSTPALRLVVAARRATGVELVRNGATQFVRATRETILCAGTIETPRMLLSSGIGPSNELDALGIVPVQHSQEVGRNLQNHPFFALSYTCKAPVTGQSLVNPLRAAKEAFQYLFKKAGILSDTFVPVGGFFAIDAFNPVPDVQVTVMPALLLQAGMGGTGGIAKFLFQPHGFLVCVNIGSPNSRGRVTLASSDPRDRPKIDLNFFHDPLDMENMLTAVRRTRAIMQQPRFSDVIDKELSPGDAAESDITLANRIRAEGTTMYHQCGTCRMGGDDASVVDTELRVRGIDGLRIADASIVPIIPNGNTHAVTIMIAERAADFIRKTA